MNRRSLLYAAGTSVIAGVSGCAGSSDSGEGARTLTDIIQIEDHEWRGATLLEVTVRNLLDEELDLVQVEADVYVGDERINHAYTNISGLPPETVETSEIRFTQSYGQNPCNADRYELVPNFSYDLDDYEKRIEYEFNPDFCQ